MYSDIRPLTSRVVRRWTLSNWLISALSAGELASNAYSGCGHTIAQYSGMNAAFDKSQKDQRIMNSNRHAVFAASLQCTDEVKAASMRKARPLMLVHWDEKVTVLRVQFTLYL